MNQKEWICREIGEWRQEGLVDAQTAETLIGRYQSGRRSLSWGMALTSGFGALLIGLGIIALFAANWDFFGRSARAVISLSPVAICGVLALIASVRGWKAPVFWESIGILWCISTAAATSLVAQTYQVGGSVPSLILFVALLMLPVVWVTKSVAAMAAWPIIAIIWACSSSDVEPQSFLLATKGVGLLLLSLPAYVAFLRRKPSPTALATGQLVTGLVYTFGTGLMLSVSSPLATCSGVDPVILAYWGTSAVVFVAALVFKLPIWPFIATLVAAGAAMPTVVDDSVLLIPSFVLSIVITTYGIVRLRLSYTNVGAVLFLALVLAKFFGSSISFTMKGIVLILSGVALTALNVVFVRFCRRRA